MRDDIKIAGMKTINDWKLLRKELLENSAIIDNWEKAFSEFLLERIMTRYIEPIEAISNISKNRGKGFSIIAIFCSLIEFFETQKSGYEFRHPYYYDASGTAVKSIINLDKKGAPLYLYNKEIFVNFLTQNSPFDQEFNIVDAESFYFNVRCSILHQAETQSGWLIKNGKDETQLLIKNDNEIVLNWRQLKRFFDNYLNVTYKEQLISDANIQNNFIFKWDKICGI
jgi:hypothetical protein